MKSLGGFVIAGCAVLSASLACGEDLKFIRGDANLDGSTDISDAIYALSALFRPDAPPLFCPDAADANDDGTVDISDPIFVLMFLFVDNASPIPPPVGELGVDPTPDPTSCRPPEGYIAVRSRPKQHFGSATWDWDRLFPELATHLERFLAFAEQQAGWSDTPTGVVYAYEEDMSDDYVSDCRECGKDYAIVAIIYGETMLRHMSRTAFASVEYLSPEGAASVGFMTISCGGPEITWCRQHPEVVSDYDDDCMTAWLSTPGGVFDAGTMVYDTYLLRVFPGGCAACGCDTGVAQQFIVPGAAAELLAELDPYYQWFIVWPAIE